MMNVEQYCVPDEKDSPKHANNFYLSCTCTWVLKMREKKPKFTVNVDLRKCNFYCQKSFEPTLPETEVRLTS